MKQSINQAIKQSINQFPNQCNLQTNQLSNLSNCAKRQSRHRTFDCRAMCESSQLSKRSALVKTKLALFRDAAGPGGIWELDEMAFFSQSLCASVPKRAPTGVRSTLLRWGQSHRQTLSIWRTETVLHAANVSSNHLEQFLIMFGKMKLAKNQNFGVKK